MNVVHNAVVAGPHKTPDHVGSHPAQSDHAYFHVFTLFLKFPSALGRGPFETHAAATLSVTS
jgi:hypothetical protein